MKKAELESILTASRENCVCVCLCVSFSYLEKWGLSLSSVSLAIFHHCDNQIAMMPRQFTQQHMTFITTLWFFFSPPPSCEQRRVLCSTKRQLFAWIDSSRFKHSLANVLFLWTNICARKIKIRNKYGTWFNLPGAKSGVWLKRSSFDILCEVTEDKS